MIAPTQTPALKMPPTISQPADDMASSRISDNLAVKSRVMDHSSASEYMRRAGTALRIHM